MFGLFKKKTGLDKAAVNTAKNLIISFNSYLSEHEIDPLSQDEMNSITESVLLIRKIETDDIIFSCYCFAVLDAVMDSILENLHAGKEQRKILNFDELYTGLCFELKLKRLI